MPAEITKVWGGGCGSGDTCPGEVAVRYPDGRRTRVRVGKRVTDPAILAELRIGPDEVPNEVDEMDIL